MIKILFSVTLFSIGCSSYAKCKLPSPDSSEHSPPSVRGKVAKVKSGLISVNVENKIVNFDISSTDSNRIFSKFGGKIEISEFKSGDYVEIWLKSCEKVTGASAKAEVIRIEK